MAKMAKKASACSTNLLNNSESCQNMTEQIRSKARELWEKRGRIQGKDLDIWLEAERMVRSEK